jgi:DNA topoisomerase I
MEENVLNENIAPDLAKIAESAGLHYVSDSMPGLTRYKRGKYWIYKYHDGTACKDKEILKRIRSLVLPPAWRKVWICPHDNGHLQATGLDMKNRKQYKYHAEWSKVRNQTKYHRMLQFSEMLPKIRQQVESHLNKKDLCKLKVLAIVVKVMERTFIRIGNSEYEKLYGSYGLTTMRDKHVKFSGDKVIFEFKGKKGVFHNIELKNRRLANLVKKCRDIPGQELFQFYDESGHHKSIDSGDVNAYLHSITGLDFTAKDFRTWAGTVNALKAFREVGEHNSQTQAKKNIVRMLDIVSKQLGNTRTVCKKYYVHPAIIEAYETGCLIPYLNELDKIEEEGKFGLTCEEKLLVKFLKEQLVKVAA